MKWYAEGVEEKAKDEHDNVWTTGPDQYCWCLQRQKKLNNNLGFLLLVIVYLTLWSFWLKAHLFLVFLEILFCPRLTNENVKTQGGFPSLLYLWMTVQLVTDCALTHSGVISQQYWQICSELLGRVWQEASARRYIDLDTTQWFRVGHVSHIFLKQIKA